MIKRGWIEAGREKPSKLKALQVFFGMAVAEPLAIQEAVGFRLSEAARQRTSLGALAVWLRQGELEAQQQQTTVYDEDTFRQALINIRRLTEQPYEEFIPTISDLCAESGVVFCMVQELPKSGAIGAMRWMKDGRPMIQMSLRLKWADIFWFTFFHEACHVLQRKQRRIVVDYPVPDPDLTEFEEEANFFCQRPANSSRCMGRLLRGSMVQRRDNSRIFRIRWDRPVHCCRSVAKGREDWFWRTRTYEGSILMARRE